MKKNPSKHIPCCTQVLFWFCTYFMIYSQFFGCTPYITIIFSYFCFFWMGYCFEMAMFSCLFLKPNFRVCLCAHFEFPYLSTNQIIKMSSHAKKSEHTRTSFQISTHLPYFFLSNWHYFTIIFTKIVPHFYRNKLKNLTMALIFKPSKLNMNAIKKNTKSLTSSKEMWKNAERLRSDSMVKSSKFTVKEWPSSKRPTTSYLSYLTKEFLTYIR